MQSRACSKAILVSWVCCSEFQGSGSHHLLDQRRPWLGFSESCWLWVIFFRVAVLLTSGTLYCVQGSVHLEYNVNGTSWSFSRWRLQPFISPSFKGCFNTPLLFGQWVCFLPSLECVDSRRVLSWFLDPWGGWSFWIPGWLSKAVPDARLGRIQKDPLCSRNLFLEQLVFLHPANSYLSLMTQFAYCFLWHFCHFPRQG